MRLGAASWHVAQDVQLCAEHKKPRKLLRFIEKLREAERAQRGRSRVLVFVNKIKTAHFVSDLLRRHNLPCTAIHSELTQQQRETALEGLRCGKIPLAVATDVAGRGIHIQGLEHVVNYDFPPNLEQYQHRVGRTGRAGKPGHALSFITRNLAKLTPDLVRLLKAGNHPVEKHLGCLAELVEEKMKEGGGVPGGDAEEGSGGEEGEEGGEGEEEEGEEAEEEEEEEPAGKRGKAAAAAVPPAAAKGKKAPAAAAAPPKQGKAASAAAAADDSDSGGWEWSDEEEEAQGGAARRKPLFGDDGAGGADSDEEAEEGDDDDGDEEMEEGESDGEGESDDDDEEEGSESDGPEGMQLDDSEEEEEALKPGMAARLQVRRYLIAFRVLCRLAPALCA